ncbi:MAG: rRNA maturation RNase YbeY [Rhodomicrobium sp.]
MTPHPAISNEPAASVEDNAGESDPARTCAAVSIIDERWHSATGLTELIPELVATSLLKVQLAPEAHLVSIALLSDDDIQELNRTFRGKDRSTNVLSFPPAPGVGTLDNEDGRCHLGDIALAYETVAEEAQAQEKTITQHAAHLVVHGILHLAGFGHENGADAECMENAERRILLRFGIADPYGDDDLLPLSAH